MKVEKYLEIQNEKKNKIVQVMNRAERALRLIELKIAAPDHYLKVELSRGAKKLTSGGADFTTPSEKRKTILKKFVNPKIEEKEFSEEEEKSSSWFF